MPQNNKTPNVKHKSRKSFPKKISPAKVAKKSRTKTRKPKYLSLKLQLSTKTPKPTTHTQQLDLFPQKHQHHMHEHDQVNEDVAFLLDTDNSTTTLHDLLDTTTSTSVEDHKPAVASKTVSYYGGGDGLLEKAAMRSKERDASEERWVSYYDVVEEVSSCSGGTTAVVEVEERKKLMGLKLDYEVIMNAWCDKGPLYVDGECPQTVPVFHASSNALGEEWGSVGNLWQVPEVGSETSMEAKKGWKLGQREASMLRYKEKRQNRLFSKRIRYEVRKLNAEKRPRLKGRFVKRDTDE